MTVIYNKRTGRIKLILSGDTNHVATVFGDEGVDYKKIFAEIIIPDDEYVIKHPKEFEVNPETKELEILSTTINQYKLKGERL